MNAVYILTYMCVFQKPSCGRKCLCGGVGQPGGLLGIPLDAPGLFQGHLGLPVLPGHC